MRPVFVFILKFAVFRAKFRKNEGEKEKKEKEKKEGKKEFKEVLISRDLDPVFEILFGCKRRIF